MSLLDTDLALTRDSYYAHSAQRSVSHAPLHGNHRCDVAVVGGGFAGLSAAIELAQRGFSVRLLESREVGSGASGRNGGQIIHGLACDQGTIEEQLGLDDARRVWDMTIEAIDLIHERCRRFDIDCEWQDGFLHVAMNARKAQALHASAERTAAVYHYPTELIGPDQMRRWIDSPRYVGGAFDRRSGHLHPLKYALGLARAAASLGVQIHEHTKVVRLEPGEPVTLHTDQGEVKARHVLLAGNVYLQGLAPKLAPRIMPVGTYVAATEPLDPSLMKRLIPSRAAVCDNNFVLDYFRPSRDNRLIFGGEASYSTATPANLRQTMQQRIGRVFPQLTQARIEHVWGGFVDITINRAPDFGRLPAAHGHKANVYYLQGFSGHGVALAGLAGRVVAEAIYGDASRFDVFTRLRHRPFPGGALLRTPALVLGMGWYRLRDMLSL